MEIDRLKDLSERERVEEDKRSRRIADREVIVGQIQYRSKLKMRFELIFSSIFQVPLLPYGRLSQDEHLFDTIGGNCPRFTKNKFFGSCRTLWMLEFRILKSVTFPEFRKKSCPKPIQRRIWTYCRSRLRFRIFPISSVTDRQLPKEHAKRLQGSAAACRLSRDELGLELLPHVQELFRGSHCRGIACMLDQSFHGTVVPALDELVHAAVTSQITPVHLDSDAQ